MSKIGYTSDSVPNRNAAAFAEANWLKVRNEVAKSVFGHLLVGLPPHAGPRDMVDHRSRAGRAAAYAVDYADALVLEMRTRV